ncbi:Arylesterase precursor, partial [hydrothermal vent metagenome]
ETTAGGLSRLGPALAQHQAAIVIIELGANDGLRGLPLTQMRDNLQKMITAAKSRGADVLLIGMRLPPNYGPRYTRGFQNIYLELAKENSIAVLPFLLEGVSEKREWMQADNLHPNAAAQPRLLENVWPSLLPQLKK